MRPTLVSLRFPTLTAVSDISWMSWASRPSGATGNFLLQWRDDWLHRLHQTTNSRPGMCPSWLAQLTILRKVASPGEPSGCPLLTVAGGEEISLILWGSPPSRIRYLAFLFLGFVDEPEPALLFICCWAFF